MQRRTLHVDILVIPKGRQSQRMTLLLFFGFVFIFKIFRLSGGPNCYSLGS